MPLIWEKITTAVYAEWDGGHLRPTSPLYRLHVPGGWLVREDAPHPGDTRGPALPASGPIHFIPDPDHTWAAEVEAVRKMVGVEEG